ncbi:hypothetical protein XENOCAPTIV_001103, partial [Xenoophorus captivus]
PYRSLLQKGARDVTGGSSGSLIGAEKNGEKIVSGLICGVLSSEKPEPLRGPEKGSGDTPGCRPSFFLFLSLLPEEHSSCEQHGCELTCLLAC